MTQQQAYSTLEVQQGASEQEIKDAYKKLAKKYHPDINKEKDAESKFKEINQAYSILTGKEQQKSGGFNGYGGYGGNGFNSDMFNQFFNGGFNINFDFENGWEQVQTNKRRTPQNGQDININLMLTAEEIFSESEKVIKFIVHKHCKKCGGTGSLDKNLNNTQQCNNCKGTGHLTKITNSAFGQQIMQTTCTHCSGYGTILRNKCNSCQNGLVNEEETLKLKINKGDYFKKNRQFIKNYGHAGMFGGRRGNANIQLIADQNSINNFDFNRIKLKDK